MTTFYCLRLETSPNLEGQVSVFIHLQEQGGPVIPPGTGFPFCRLLRLAGLRPRYSKPPPHGILNKDMAGRWIGTGRPIAWPPRSPDLTPLDYFFCGYVKNIVY
jgi:hypothetical protein